MCMFLTVAKYMNNLFLMAENISNWRPLGYNCQDSCIAKHLEMRYYNQSDLSAWL